ncbi:cytochrome P450 [Coprinopsis cinerea okayama7|uniref:Cytochrome P450 n=1 Tax=Coprinopsis cinerea (strain Okayama-7 / 130 / ATCC MYA-4618 / FGSC 9003) TaxID=240176 RepID=A8N8J0_COPC7|nr:cytochrome P450 [Coprinopsis cinerea okayama7\|eukprot:XP_001831146.2 cytochrome P450 [Coprinopsis cinerea okayama7\
MDSVWQGLEAAKELVLERPGTAAASLGALYAAWLVYHLGDTRKVNHIPSLASNSAILSYLDGIKFFARAPQYAAESYEKLRSQVIKVPGLFNWIVLVHGHDLVEQVRKAPDHQLDFHIAVTESLQTPLTMGPAIESNPYHIGVVRNQLKRFTPQLIPAVHDEIANWASVVAHDEIMKVICRASNRTFVGLPVCRDPDYIDLNIKYTIDVVTSAAVLRLFPPFLRKTVHSVFLPATRKRVEQGVRHLAPLIKHRREQIALLGDEYERPMDFLMWLMEEAKGEETAERALTLRILVLNFAAIHTSTMTFTQALYDLAAHPEYQEPLREEARAAVKEHGWSKTAVDKFVKIDSFIKESQRHHPMASVMMNRHVLEDFTLANGVKVPKGLTLAVDITGMHQSSEYGNPSEFDPWRFSRIQEAGKRSDMTTTNAEFLAFGHGRHACPGRFFAAVELKLMMAYVVLNYDVKCEGERPKNLWLGVTCAPNPKAKLLFRKREPGI